MESALHAVAFIQECCTLTDGKRRGEPFVLEPWQMAAVGNAFGWKLRSNPKRRRYRRWFLTAARGTGKTELGGAVANYMLFCDVEPSPECIGVAGNAEQAQKLMAATSRMVEQEPELLSRAEVMKRSIMNHENGGSLQIINSASRTKHGGRPHFIYMDEAHCVDDVKLFDVLETSLRKRENSLIYYATTAGEDLETGCGEVYTYACKVRDKLVTDEAAMEFLPCIWEVPHDADISSPEAWRLGQPNMGITVFEEDYRKKYQEAIQTPRLMQSFRQLFLNQWTEPSAAWITLENWRKCSGVVELESLRGQPAFIGVDLSSTIDTTAVVAGVPKAEKLLLIPRIFIPQENTTGLLRRQKRDKAPYQAWVKADHIEATPGNVIDYDRVIEYIISLSKILDIWEIQIDPKNASNVNTQLGNAGLKVTLMSQGWSLNEATKETERLILKGDIVHPDNPAFNWQWASATVKDDHHENIWPDKMKSTRRMDAVVASVMAVNGWKFGEGREVQTADSYYTNNPELIVLDA